MIVRRGNRGHFEVIRCYDDGQTVAKFLSPGVSMRKAGDRSGALAGLGCLWVLASIPASAGGQSAATHQWTWVGGSSAVPTSCSYPLNCGQPGSYGSLGSPAPGNVPGGRYGGNAWTSADGRFWLYGGTGIDSTGARVGLGDLWNFDPSTGVWTWISGSDTLAEAAAYGTQGSPSAANIPGGRTYSSQWTDAAGNFWMFAGNLASDGKNPYNSETNDLWKYQRSASEWTWVGGADSIPMGLVGESGSYGTLGIPSSTNYPGTRAGAFNCTDPAGEFWLFGGGGVDSVGNPGPLDDLWQYSPTSGLWTWMAGHDKAEGTSAGWSPSYGTQNLPAPSNTPGSRQFGSCWVDSGGNLWLLGGGEGASGTDLNDMWEFSPITLEWTWEGGSAQTMNCIQGNVVWCGQPGIYGSLGAAAASNQPGARQLASSWVDQIGNLWLFGGVGFDGLGNYGELNDLWEFSPMTRQWTWQGGGSSIEACTPPLVTLYCGNSGVYGNKGSPDAANTPGGRDSAMGWTDPSGSIWLFGGEGYDGLGQYGNLNDLWRIEPAASGLPKTANPEFSLASGIFTSAQTVSLSDSTAGATIYFSTDGTPPSLNSQTYSGPLTVSSTTALEAIAVASGHSMSQIVSGNYLFPPLFELAASQGSVQLTAGSSAILTLTVKPENGFNSPVLFDCSGLPADASCTFNPSIVTPSGGSATSQLTIAASASASNAMPLGNPLLPTATLALAGCTLLWKKRRVWAGWTAAVILWAGLLTLSACGGSGGGTSPPTPTNATVTVTGSSASAHETVKITLTINH